MKRFTMRISIALTLGLGLTLALLWLLSSPGERLPAARAADSPRPASAPGDALCVALEGGGPYSGCSQVFTNVQAAVDFATGGEIIKVATGVYTDVSVRPRNDFTTTDVVTQNVYISKTVTIQGGYTTTNWTTPYPITQPTTLDARGWGRVIYIIGSISPTIEGLHITRGNAAWLGGMGGGYDAGGGVYVTTATVTLSNNLISNNTTPYYGGGLCFQSGVAILHGNTITSNTALYGGGLYLDTRTTAVLSGNSLSSNTAQYGGGLFLGGSNAAQLDSNLIASNTANEGGGLYLDYGSPTLDGNTITTNTANSGGGLYLWYGAARLTGNAIASNTADNGGGLYLSNGTATIGDNVVTFNTANDGGGVFLWFDNATLNNNVVADNHANHNGSGLHLVNSSPRLLHNTIARNAGGDDSGVYVTGWSPYSSIVTLSNTILVSHTTGIIVTAGNAATLNGVLWFGTGTNTGGAGFITVTNEITGDPAFAPDGYHLTAHSAAIDKGVDAGVTTDIDGQVRPRGAVPDLGADEFYPASSLIVTKQADPNPVQAGALLTYTIRVTNTGDVALHATITDTLPTHVISGKTSGGTVALPGQPLTWTAFIPISSAWTETVVVTTEPGYAGWLTNVVQVTTDEGASGDYAQTTLSLAPYLQVTKHASPDPVQAGAPLVYTLRVTNTGTMDLHATITDTLPTHVTSGRTSGGTALLPGQPFTWTALIPISGTWTETVVVTTAMDYSGTLANVVQVTTDEGATGVYTETSAAFIPQPNLQVTKHANPTVQAGERLTYILRVTNTGNVDLHAAITDMLPAHVTPGGVLTWTPVTITPGNVWSQTIVVTVEMGYAGPLTNVVQATTDEGASGIYTETTQAQVTPRLQVTKHADPTVQAGALLTYTLRVTNTGNVDLHATITDTLPAHVTPGDVLTWTATISAPDGVWSQTVVVTPEVGYAGPLTNVIQATTTEGAAGIYTITTLSLAPHLQVTKHTQADPVQPGAQLTYTLRVTNTGNVDLLAIITDTLPSHVTPTGILTWTATVPISGVWTQQVVVTVGLGYAGPLTNTVQVTTAEGATGMDSVAVNVIWYKTYLPLVLKNQ